MKNATTKSKNQLKISITVVVIYKIERLNRVQRCFGTVHDHRSTYPGSATGRIYLIWLLFSVIGRSFAPRSTLPLATSNIPIS